jgi:hypothetical protein
MELTGVQREQPQSMQGDFGGPKWTDFEELKVLRMESKGDLWMDMYESASIRRGLSAASVLEIQESEDFSSHDGSLPSCSSSSERHSSTDLIDGATEVIAILEDGEVRAMLQDAEVRAVLRKVIVNEGVLNKAIQSLGGGEKGLKSLMEYIMVWVKQQRDIQSSSQQPSPPPPSNLAWNFSTAQNVVLQPSSDAFQIFSGILQPPPTTQVLDQEMRYSQRLKSRKLMTGKPELGAGLGGLDDSAFCTSSFISSPEDCKSEMSSPDIMAPRNPQQQQSVTPFTSAHLAMPFVEPTPAMTTKAARRHRMTRQRQSFHARAASPVARAPASVGGVWLWNTNAATSPAATSSGMSVAQITPRSTPVTASQEVPKDLQPKF